MGVSSGMNVCRDALDHFMEWQQASNPPDPGKKDGALGVDKVKKTKLNLYKWNKQHFSGAPWQIKPKQKCKDIF